MKYCHRKLCGKKYLISSQTNISKLIEQKSGIALWLQFTVFPDVSTIGGNKHDKKTEIIFQNCNAYYTSNFIQFGYSSDGRK